MRNFMIVLKKELRDFFRDKRSLVMMLIPILLFPLLLGFAKNQEDAADNTLATEITIATHNESAILDLVSGLEASGLKVNVLSGDDSVDNLKSGKVMLILDKDETGYQICYDPVSIKSSKAAGVVTSIIEAQKLATINAVLNLHGESIDFLNEFNYFLQDVNSSEEVVGDSYISLIAPMMLVLFITSNGGSFAADLFCGEKERGSLESLLATQVNRKSLYFAKLVTTMVFGGFGVLVSVGSYLLSYISTGQIDAVSSTLGVSQILLILAVSISFAFFTNSVVCALAIGAKTLKEANLRISLFTIIPSLLGTVTMYMETGNMPISRSFVPVFNVLGALKSIFIDVVQPEQIVITILTNLVYGVIFVFIGQKIINSEKVLSK